MLGATKGGNTGARFWREIFKNTLKDPISPLNTLSLSQLCVGPGTYQSAPAAADSDPPRPAPGEELHLQELQLRSALDEELQEGQGGLMKWRRTTKNLITTKCLLMDFRSAALVENE